MGTHISRVKSADLDAWTDEQTQMMVKWGNRRANKYIPIPSLPSFTLHPTFLPKSPLFLSYF